LAPANTSQTAVHFVGGGTKLTENGANQIVSLQAPSGNLPISNNILTTALVVNPDGTLDFATLAGGANGIAIVPLPAEGYINSFVGSNPTSNVRIMSGTVTLD